MEITVLVTILIVIWGAISLISFFTGKYIINKSCEDRELIETLMKTKKGKDILIAFGNTFSVAITCLIPLVHILPLIGFTYSFIIMKKNYDSYRSLVISAVKEIEECNE